MNNQKNPTSNVIDRSSVWPSLSPPLPHGTLYPSGTSPVLYPMQCGGSCGSGQQGPPSGPLNEFVTKSMPLINIFGTKIEINETKAPTSFQCNHTFYCKWWLPSNKNKLNSCKTLKQTPQTGWEISEHHKSRWLLSCHSIENQRGSHFFQWVHSFRVSRMGEGRNCILFAMSSGFPLWCASIWHLLIFSGVISTMNTLLVIGNAVSIVRVHVLTCSVVVRLSVCYFYRT